jgi:hypothetical protein
VLACSQPSGFGTLGRLFGTFNRSMGALHEAANGLIVRDSCFLCRPSGLVCGPHCRFCRGRGSRSRLTGTGRRAACLLRCLHDAIGISGCRSFIRCQ